MEKETRKNLMPAVSTLTTHIDAGTMQLRFVCCNIEREHRLPTYLLVFTTASILLALLVNQILPQPQWYNYYHCFYLTFYNYHPKKLCNFLTAYFKRIRLTYLNIF